MPPLRLGPALTRRLSSRASPPVQARPLTGFYLELLTNPLTPANPSLPRPSQTPAPAPAPAASPVVKATPPNAAELTPTQRAAIVFGSPLTGPTEEKAIHEAGKRRRGQWVAGVWVPPRPEEPDNCCMSGCVNCVLSTFMEDLDEWKAARRRADVALQREGMAAGSNVVGDGGGTAGEGLWEGYEDIPVGLRVFMETEKRLREKGKEAATAGGVG